MPDNFHLAPLATTVDGLVAVPIDIQHLEASFEFDAAASMCIVDATIDFIMGPTDGNPIFDLRQTIDDAWLDGSTIAPALLDHHDFGGGADARMRIVETALPAGTAHTLRLVYTLALPDADNSSSGPPTYDWNGDRLNLKFWYTDLRPGRYLDAWLPGNLIFDQFSTHLDIRILNSAVDHILISNGTQTDVAANHWDVSFPDWFTVCSSFLRIHPSDEVESQTGTVFLSGSGNVDVHTYKLQGDPTDLAVQQVNIMNMLQSNVAGIGPFAHDNRFTVFFDSPSGMEYNGATKTTVSLLEHEIYHSWWGRGVQPASQNDGWWDEGWTTFVTTGAGSVPFDFSDPSLELYSQNQWVRTTSSLSYTGGKDIFAGLSALMGRPALDSAMSAFYTERTRKLATTLELEGAMLCSAADETVVDAFHRFVYGFEEPVSPPDLWMRDDVGHTGDEDWGGAFWNSPDLWIRHADDEGTTHQGPMEGIDNWFYARVRNRGSSSAQHFMVTFTVKPWAGTEFVYPTDFIPCTAATGGFELAPDEEKIVSVKWPAASVPPAGTHACLLASVIARGDHPSAGDHVWQDNNLAQRNLTIEALDSDGWVVVPVLVGNKAFRARSLALELVRPQGNADMAATILRPVRRKPRPAKTDHLDCGGADEKRRTPAHHVWTNKRGDSWASAHFKGAAEMKLKAGRRIPFRLFSKNGFPVLIGLRLQVPRNAKKGSILLSHLFERRRKRIVGGISVQINVGG